MVENTLESQSLIFFFLLGTHPLDILEVTKKVKESDWSSLLCVVFSTNPVEPDATVAAFLLGDGGQRQTARVQTASQQLRKAVSSLLARCDPSGASTLTQTLITALAVAPPLSSIRHSSCILPNMETIQTRFFVVFFTPSSTCLPLLLFHWQEAIISTVRSAAVTRCCRDTNIIISHIEWAQKCSNGKPKAFKFSQKGTCTLHTSDLTSADISHCYSRSSTLFYQCRLLMCLCTLALHVLLLPSLRLPSDWCSTCPLFNTHHPNEASGYKASDVHSVQGGCLSGSDCLPRLLQPL